MSKRMAWLAAAVIGILAAAGGVSAAADMNGGGVLTGKSQTDFERRELEMRDALLRRQYENMEMQRFDLDLKREFLRVENADKRGDKRDDKKGEIEVINAKIKILEGRMDANRKLALQVAVALARIPQPPQQAKTSVADIQE